MRHACEEPESGGTQEAREVHGHYTGDSLLEPISPEVWNAFHNEFDLRVNALGRTSHWCVLQRRVPCAMLLGCVTF